MRIAAKHMKAPVIGLKGLQAYFPTFASNICLTVKNVFVLIPQNHTNTTKVRRKITVEAEDNSRGRYHGKDEIEM